jgi:hypothetical protein
MHVVLKLGIAAGCASRMHYSKLIKIDDDTCDAYCATFESSDDIHAIAPIAARRPQSITQSPDRLGLNSDYLGMSGDKHDDSVQC